MLLFHGVSVSRGWKRGEEEQVKRGQGRGGVWMKVRKECAKQHLQRRRGEGCGYKREKAFPNNICTECNICQRRARWEEDAVLDDLMMGGFTVAWGWADPVSGFLSYQTDTITPTGGGTPGDSTESGPRGLGLPILATVHRVQIRSGV